MLFKDVSLRTRRVLMLFKDVLLRTRRVLMLFKDFVENQKGVNAFHYILIL